jgi:hypothetical protein
MSLPLDLAKETAARLLSGRGQNTVAQTDARHILQEVGEAEANYPSFDNRLTEKSTHIAHTLIACGCSIIENSENTSDTDEGLTLLEKAGKILSDTYECNPIDEIDRGYNLLIAGMSLFAAKQYSRAFVVLKDVDLDFCVGQIIISFIRKDFMTLLQQTTAVFFSDSPDEPDIRSIDEWVISHEIARCFMSVTHFVDSGNNHDFVSLHETLNKLLVITVENGLTLYWLIIRLLKILFSSFYSASLWTVLPPLFPASDLRDSYIRLMGTADSPVTEIWPSQIDSLDLAFGDNAGAIINLRTSGGKTRVAELAMLQSLDANPDSIILYLAPFRSLAFELEKSLGSIFTPLGFTITHLYGNATINLSDFELVQESNIVIATPEKAKALIRGGSGIENRIKLIVVDEGHLLGANDRYIRNELFLTHVKEYASRNSIRIILLSAVLPNAGDMATWIANDSSLVAKSEWKPSLERTGLLLWDGSKVRLEWYSENQPFNPRFIQKRPLGYGKRRNGFPNKKVEAVAATAVRLADNGTVMIFSARANSIKGIAESVLLAMGQNPPNFDWDILSWTTFENLCNEELEAESMILKAARRGIICHSNKLTPNVRIAMEKLMRSKAPTIIIASSTLGQGVNIGISTVIVNSPYYSDAPISARDFWNICGRAGRAYSDAEGKILYAIDMQRKKWQVDKDRQLAEFYFQRTGIEEVKSGLTMLLRCICHVATKAGVDFNNLLELIANDFKTKKLDEKTVQYLMTLFDLIDDELLAMHSDFADDTDSIDWVETVFKQSLAIIQADAEEQAKFISLLGARAKGIVSRITDRAERQRLVATGIPFSVARAIISDKKRFRAFGEEFYLLWSNDNLSTELLAKFIKTVEVWVSKNALTLYEDNSVTQSALDIIRQDWLAGVELANILEKDAKAGGTIKDYYGFTLPWVLHAISQVFDETEDVDIIKSFSILALLVELGLPTETAANVFLAGVRSRSAAIEISDLDCTNGKSISELKSILIAIASLEKHTLSDNASNWVKGIADTFRFQRKRKLSFPTFTMKLNDGTINKLLVREHKDVCYLMSPDGSYQREVDSTEDLPFERIANKPSLYFTIVDDAWELRSYNPRIIVVDSEKVGTIQ